MDIEKLANTFVEMCNQFKNFDVMRSMYSPSIVSVEADGHETKGKEEVIKKSEVWAANNEIHSEQARGPFFNGKTQFAVHFTFEVTRKSTGKRETIEEVGVYTVSGEEITREQFFYSGTH